MILSQDIDYGLARWIEDCAARGRVDVVTDFVARKTREGYTGTADRVERACAWLRAEGRLTG